MTRLYQWKSVPDGYIHSLHQRRLLITIKGNVINRDLVRATYGILNVRTVKIALPRNTVGRQSVL
jgi:hypothetical protein